MNNLFANLPMLMGAPGGTGAQAASGSGQLVTTIITFGLVFVIFYFLIIRPQNKKQKDTKRMLEALKKGDRVVTAGGMRGTIASIRDDVIVLKVDGATKIEFNRSAISGVVQAKAGSGRAKIEKQDEDVEEASDDENAENETTTESKE
ncbi:MAG TPA: preprotein translocase subunit YajC [Spirochaetia bacterium]|nr:preprotein translocase subunit YajC [Spirochaetia bacterium]